MGPLLRDRRALLAALLCLGIAVTFWSGSRYPNLNEKASMGGGVVLEDPLGFEALAQVDELDPPLVRVAQTTLNWISTNQRGMTFGLLLAAGFMTLFRRIGRSGFRGSFSNSLLGVLIGAPLGVCVNCAAPIARGMHASGLRLETSLAAMISSPTLNFVVVGMMFAMFPTQLVLLKLGGGLAFTLIVLPLLARFVFRRERLAGVDPSQLADVPTGQGRALDEPLFETSEGFGQALVWVARDFAGNLWFIVKNTVPLMLAAGLIGAVAVTVLPWDVLVASLPRDESWLAYGWMVGVALFGLLLPVPIAFDVVVSAALLAAGMPTAYVMVLLFSLGIFSVYSFLIVWQAASLRVAATLSVGLLALSVGLGIAAEQLERRDGARQLAVFAALRDAPPPPRPDPRPVAPPRPADDLLPALRAHAPAFEPAPLADADGLRVSRTAFAPRRAGDGPLFDTRYGDTVGLERIDSMPPLYKFQRPFFSNWPIAAGDVHGDGYVDVLVGSDRGPQLYANLGDGRFARQDLAAPALEELFVGNAALVDLDDDGWLDVVFSAYRSGNHVLWNQGGRFSAEKLEPLHETDANLADAMAFGDIDRDGRLDVVLGNWTSGRWTAEPPEASRNQVLYADAGGYTAVPLPGTPGETLTTLLSDLDGDGLLDLMVGNGFKEVADDFYFGAGGRRLEPSLRNDGVIPRSGDSTMSFDTADIDNDGVPELYIGQITGRRPNETLEGYQVETDQVCDDHSDADWKERCESNMRAHATLRDARRQGDASVCLSIANPVDRGDCVAYTMMLYALRRNDIEECRRIPGHWEPLSFVCQQHFRKPSDDGMPRRQAIRQDRGRNFLLVRQPDGTFADRARDLGIHVGGWTWNARFADFDNDEWQDLYLVNGFFSSEKRESNLYYRNLAGRGFENATSEVGLKSHLDALGWVAFDLENDGDLDLVTSNTDGPLWLHENRGGDGHALAFELVDHRGNRFGVGSRIDVHYGAGGERRQMREIKAGGGYVSFDAPIAHFGLGLHESVSRVEIRWSTGETSVLTGPFAAGYRYRVERPAGATASARASSRSPASPPRPGT
ncbi:MAG: FG-GAP-like repeat-containing protein [Myxococcota bacterium]